MLLFKIVIINSIWEPALKEIFKTVTSVFLSLLLHHEFCMKSLLYSRLPWRHWGAVVNRGASCLHRAYKPVGSKHQCHHFTSKCAVNSQGKSVMLPKSPSETWPVQRGPGTENDYYLPHSSNVGDKPEGGQWERAPWRKRQRWGENHSSCTCWVWIRTSRCAPPAIFFLFLASTVFCWSLKPRIIYLTACPGTMV